MNVTRLRLRAAAVVLSLASLPLYAAEEAVSRLQGCPYLLPGEPVDKLDALLVVVDARLTAAGDGGFIVRLIRVMDGACNAVDTVLTRLTGRA